MGIFGALSTAVTGLRAQAFALENISGNIANSQTTAFKRQDTSFSDLIPDAVPTRQLAGSVLAQSRSSNTVQGDINSAGVDTYMAINGDGYFTISSATGFVDGRPIFGGTDLYTRRGDFEVDKDGYLVNGAGYYLKALPVDRATGNTSGSVPEVLRLTNDILPARETTLVTYRANLPSYPLTSTADPDLPGSELLNASVFSVDPRTATSGLNPATTTGSTVDAPGDLENATGLAAGDAITIAIAGGGTATFTIGTGSGEYNTLADLVAAINADPDLAGLVQADGAGDQLSLTSAGVGTSFTASGVAATALGVGGSFAATAGAGQGTVMGADEESFIAQSISGGAVTVYDEQGAPVSIQLRWAKVDGAATGGQDTWNLFYMRNSDAGATDVAWQNMGTDFTFGANGQMNPQVASLNLSGAEVDGAAVGDIQLSFGARGITQFADANGSTKIVALSQDGYAAGEVVRVSISDNGRISAFYSNGQMADIAQIPLVSFNADNNLKRLDGGAFAATFESGQAIPSASGTIIGSSLEGSNADIADEFTKLIVTQQAYAANTRIVSTADQMLQEALNMKR